MHEHILRIPEEDEELEIVHLLLKNTVPNVNIIGAYLDGEKDVIKTERVWAKLTGKIEIALCRGEEVILMGDLKRPLQTPTLSFVTKLLLDWEETGQIKVLNTKNIHPRIDPCTRKGSTFDVGVISVNLRDNVIRFKVDTKKNGPLLNEQKGKVPHKKIL